ncbi:hypothetical protein pipiens_014671 [Culex pipiens pipiens]|uniref:Uncharacterized protein n=1 Tax=Culex pipiens pipiens TaxID=38569 RepID=A0ABD1CU46_CULPP
MSTKLLLNIECFMNEINVSSPLQRQIMEQMCAGLLQRIAASIKKLLVDSKLTPEEIHSTTKPVTNGTRTLARSPTLIRPAQLVSSVGQIVITSSPTTQSPSTSTALSWNSQVAEEEPAKPEFFEKNKATVAKMEPEFRSSSKVSLLENLCRSNRIQFQPRFQRTVIIPADRRAGGNFDGPAIVLIVEA